jgi:hypothetical protein
MFRSIFKENNMARNLKTLKKSIFYYFLNQGASSGLTVLSDIA